MGFSCEQRRVKRAYGFALSTLVCGLAFNREICNGIARRHRPATTVAAVADESADRITSIRDPFSGEILASRVSDRDSGATLSSIS